MILRRRTVTVAPDVAGYIDSLKPLIPGIESLWTGVIWHLEHKADDIGEPIMGSTYIGKVKLNRQTPQATIAFKMSATTVHILDIELGGNSAE